MSELTNYLNFDTKLSQSGIMLKNLIIVILVLALSGCSLLSDYARVVYENSNSVSYGQVIKNKRGLYTVKVPEEYLYAQQNSYNLELIGQDLFGMKYLIFTKPIKQLPVDTINNLQTAKQWIEQKIIEPRAKDVPQILLERPTTFHADNALYFESFFQLRSRKFGNGTVVERPDIGYINLIFYHNNHLYWLYYSQIHNTWGKEIKAQEHVTDEMRKKFDLFLEGLSLP